MSWPENTAFSSHLPTLQLAYDSTSLGALKTCPRKYQLSIVEGWIAKSRSVDLDFGIYLHSARETYYRARAQGLTHEPALDKAIQYALTITWDEQLQRPWNSGDSSKNRFTLLRTLVWYLDKWGDSDPLETVLLANGKPAVEVSFRFSLGFGPHYAELGGASYDSTRDSGGHGDEYLLCGHLDRLVRFQERLWISDLKSTRSGIDQYYFAQFSPDNQMSCYALGGKIALQDKVAGIIIDAAQVLVEGSRFGRGLVERTEAQLHEFLRSLHSYIKQAENYAKNNFWPQNDKACFRCEFRSICSKSPSVREQWLKADFVKRVWDPLRVRGDI